MFRPLCALLLVCALLLTALPALAQDRTAARLKEIDAQIAKLEKELARLKAERAKLAPPADLPAARRLNMATIDVGQVVYFPSGFEVKIREVISGDEVRVNVTGRAIVDMILKTSTKGMVEGKFFLPRGNWHIKETKRHLGTTYYYFVPVK